MAFDDKNLKDYVDVATRLAEFRHAHPGGSLQPIDPAEPWRMVQVQGFEKNGEVAQQTFIVYTAAAYRAADDPRPGIGCAWEVFPGRTPYTRGSELMNAETSAWGRAIVAVLAADTRKGIATRQDVELAQERQASNGHEDASPPADPWAGEPTADIEPENRPGGADGKQLKAIHTSLTAIGVTGRDDGLALLGEITGSDLLGPHTTPDGDPRTSKNLTWQDAEKARKELAKRAAVAKREQMAAAP